MFSRNNTRSRGHRRDTSPSVWKHTFVGIGVCSLIVLFMALLWYVTRLPAFTIASVVVEGGDTVSKDMVHEEIMSVLTGSYLTIVPYTFSLTYPEERLARVIASIPRVKDVDLTRDATSLSVVFTEYVPFALWCKNIDDACFFVDETGFAFAPGPRLHGGALVRHIFEEGGDPEKKQVFETDAFRSTHEFLDQLNERLKIRVTDVFYTKDGDVKLYVNGGGELIFKEGESYDVLYENLASVLASDEFKHLEPGNFKYIDLRFGNKIFVNERYASEATTTATGTIPE